MILFLSALSHISHSTERMVFQEHFNSLDLDVWQHQLSFSSLVPNQFNIFTNNRSVTFARNGVLHLKPKLTSSEIGEANLGSGYRMDLWGGTQADRCTSNRDQGCQRTSDGKKIISPTQSAMLKTRQSFKFGRFEIRAKFPQGDWLRTTLQLSPEMNSYGAWPASGEINIAESRGNSNYSVGGVQSFTSSVRWGTDPKTRRFSHEQLNNSQPLSAAFHTYGLYWDNHSIYTYLDSPANKILNLDINTSFWDRGEFQLNRDNPWKQGTMAAPFDQNFNLAIGLTVGGTDGFFPDGTDKPWSNYDKYPANNFYINKSKWLPTWTQDLQIDWIRVYSFDEHDEAPELEYLYEMMDGVLQENWLGDVEQLSHLVKDCLDRGSAIRIFVFITNLLENATRYTTSNEMAIIPAIVSSFMQTLPQTVTSCTRGRLERLKNAYGVVSLTEFGQRYTMYARSNFDYCKQFAINTDAAFRDRKYWQVGMTWAQFGHRFS